MTRNEQLQFCKVCQLRQMDMKQGLVCSLTGNIATFTSACEHFNLDEKIKTTPQVELEPLTPGDVIHRITPEQYARLKSEQNLAFGIYAGIIAGFLGAVVWGAIAAATGFQIGWLALGIGFGVGFGVRTFGNGIEPVFGAVGAIISLFSVFLGKFFALMAIIAKMQDVNVLDLIFGFDYRLLPQLMSATFSFMDILFYGLALYAGFKYSIRTFNDKDIEKIRADKSLY
ncbi:hypothetical protein [Alkalitalea saponilacus]|uniref:Uncharacterized protein n=1 Tax=Alkalitalea saponilacus TaxID=889453 RepID=A0A1T5HEU5_9BACT|nr:hypothetical protein [Alkalitalea saponilacus]ASB48079.1 hypothetical protein CDL62_02425 [Alkalitalea saponilacus]SKC19192.1 hypothetical protein SAMN03080601_02251 [Alkalitalea saponilacus]